MEWVEYLRHRPPWHLRRTGFPIAWRLCSTYRPASSRPVHVGILDSGVDIHHPALQDLLGPGVNLLRDGEPPLDENGHGTHVTGIIAAAIGALEGRERPAAVVLHPVKIFDRTGLGRIGDIIRGLEWCIAHGMDIINLSFGTDLKTSRALQRAIRQVESAGILSVGAAGNDGSEGAVDFPGRYPEVLAVAASTRRDELAPFSSNGTGVDLVAPGSGVISLAPGGGILRMSGTSMAAPHVTAAATLLLGLEPGLTPAGIRKRLKATAEWLPLVSARAQGAGILRVDRLLRWRRD